MILSLSFSNRQRRSPSELEVCIADAIRGNPTRNMQSVMCKKVLEGSNLIIVTALFVSHVCFFYV